jgi:hypothetical protein
VSDAIGPIAPTAKQRLQATRQALMHELVPSTRADTPRRPAPSRSTTGVPGAVSDAVAEGPHGSDTAQDDETPAPSGSGWFSVARHSVRAWWEFHPVRVVGVIAEPVLAEYARRRPLKLVSIAAGIGAAVVVTRPWRMVSLGGLAVAALKSSQVSNFALSFLSKNNRK